MWYMVLDDKQLLAQFAAAALTGVLSSAKESDGSSVSFKGMPFFCLQMAEAMLAEFKQRTEQKGNE